MDNNFAAIAAEINKIKFRKKIFGGIDEEDVWKKFEKISKMYEDEIELQKKTYEAVLSEYRKKDVSNSEILKE